MNLFFSNSATYLNKLMYLHKRGGFEVIYSFIAQKWKMDILDF